ncbi:hypothetical protein [Actinoplanes auranticolor]|uniref:hypothetical protein n=1 Tax=Actinoplanes auranticolor TaxID=47988 RepID=UPI001BB43E99|nr:hypothetical protein [Actinoplanes auranticolor]
MASLERFAAPSHSSMAAEALLLPSAPFYFFAFREKHENGFRLIAFHLVDSDDSRQPVGHGYESGSDASFRAGVADLPAGVINLVVVRSSPGAGGFR